MYSTIPVFTTTQIGYQCTLLFDTNDTSNISDTSYELYKINIPVGVYMLEGAYKVSMPNNYIIGFSNTSNIMPQYSISNFSAGILHLSCIVQNTTLNTWYFLFQSSGDNIIINNIFFYYTRIA